MAGVVAPISDVTGARQEGGADAGRTAGGDRPTSLTSLQRAIGNNAVAGLVAGAGRPLDDRLRARFEQSYGAALAGVRVHDDSSTHAFVAERHAEAVTIGDNIYLGPGTRRGTGYEQLLAHETAHVVQQQRGAPRRITSVGEYMRLEHEADSAAAGALDGAPVALAPGGVGEQHLSQPGAPAPDAALRASAARTTVLALGAFTPELRDMLAADPSVYDDVMRRLIARDADWITDKILEFHVDDDEETEIVDRVRGWALTPKLDGGNYLDVLLDAIKGYRYQFDYGVTETAWGNSLDKLYHELEEDRYTAFLFLVDNYSERYRGYRGRGGFGRWSGIQTAVMPERVRDRISELNRRLAGRTTVPMTEEDIQELNAMYAQLRIETLGLIDMPAITVAAQEGQQAAPALAAPVVTIAAILYALLLAILVTITIGLIIAILDKIRLALDRADAEPWAPVEPWRPPPPAPPPPGPEPAQPEPAQPEPAQPEPAQPEPAQPEPAQPDPGPDTGPGPDEWTDPPIDPIPDLRQRPDEDEDERRRRRPEIILKLPSAKAVHVSLYRALLGRLVHDILYSRDADAQLDRWDRSLNPRRAEGMYQEVYDRGVRMGLSDARIYRPTWSQFDEYINMQVDHVVELQVVPPDEVDEIWDHPGNYELLDQSSNASSGSQLRANIAAERARLVEVTGDPSWLWRELRFTRVVVGEGASGQRWLRDEIRVGRHLDALRRHQRDR